MKQKKVERNKSLEELRCLAMMMVVVLHFLGKGDLLGSAGESMSLVDVAAWVPETFCIVAVNVYMLISGYFLCESSFKLSRLLTLYLQVWMYSVGVGLVAVLTGIAPADEVNTHYFLSLLFPVSMGHYWFMTAYVFLYLLLPLVGSAVKRMSKGQLKLVLILLLGMFCLLKSILPFRLEQDVKGYDVLWYLCVFLVAAYIRKFGLGLLKNRLRCMLLYLGGCLAALVMLGVMGYLYKKTGSFQLVMKNSIDYNHVLILAASVGLFGFFLHGKGEGILGNLAGKVGPYVLGVYLLHENIGIRYGWQKWFGAAEIVTIPQLLVGIILAVAGVFATGVIVERLRSRLVKGMAKVLSHLPIWKKLMEKLAWADTLFVENK